MCPLDNNSYEIINNLAGFYREEGNYSKSIDLYLKALQINPQNYAIINNLAKAYFDSKVLEICNKHERFIDSDLKPYIENIRLL